MPPRQKTKFEQWFSWSRHQRRAGAAQVLQELHAVDIEQLKQQTISGDSIEYTYGSAKDLQQHLNALRAEFVGSPELAHYHASLIVLLRRDVDVATNYQRLKQLWLAERDFLLGCLNTRWLICACDSMVDHDDDPLLQALLMNAVMLINTLKLQETEAILCQHDYTEDPKMRDQLQQQRVALFDGTSAFAVGTDDTLRNMRWRLEKICRLHPLGQIVLEIFDRLQQASNPNVYLRFKQRHQRERTRWW